MTPNTRSGGGAPPPSRVYYSSPALQQTQFPATRKRIRTYGKQTKPDQTITSSNRERSRQQTLTQIQFVSSYPEEDDVVSGSSDEDFNHNGSELGTPVEYDDPKKGREHNVIAIGDGTKTEQDWSEDDVTPVARQRDRRRDHASHVSAKRRRTLGDEISANKRREITTSRRRTMGNSPTTTSKHHKQRLTHFVEKDVDGAYSDEDENDGFLTWLGRESQSPSIRTNAVAQRDSTAWTRQNKASRDTNSPRRRVTSREASVIPQTPAKVIRFALPTSSREQPSPSSVELVQQSPSKSQPSPLHRRDRLIENLPAELNPQLRATSDENLRQLVIQDSYATDSWESVKGTPPDCSRTMSQPHSTVRDIPASTAASRHDEQIVFPIQQKSVDKMSEVVRAKTIYSEQETITQRTSLRREEIPDSEDDEFSDLEHFSAVMPEKESSKSPAQDRGCFIASEEASEETQLLMEQIQSSVSQWVRSHVEQNLQKPPSPSRSARRARTKSSDVDDAQPQLRLKRLRKPQTYHIEVSDIPTESQRVPVATLQSFPPASARTDILLPISSAVLLPLLQGYQLAIEYPFKIPEQVVRFWLLDNQTLRYMANVHESVEHRDSELWSYRVSQIYELNNPMKEEDMRAEEWIHGNISRYAYFPPAVVGQLLWNLRHAIFRDSEEGSDVEDDQEQETRLPTNLHDNERDLDLSVYSDDATASSPVQNRHLSPDSTPLPMLRMPPPPLQWSPHNNPSLLATRRNEPPHPSQATTVSDSSESDMLPSGSRAVMLPAALSSDSVTFLDQGESSDELPFSVIEPDAPQEGTLQLLTKSQMLPESLLRDDMQLPIEIWDSDDEGNEPI